MRNQVKLLTLLICRCLTLNISLLLAFYTSKYGYKMCLRIYLNGDGTGRGSHLSLFFVVMRGLSDALLKWPFNQKVKDPEAWGWWPFMLKTVGWQSKNVSHFCQHENINFVSLAGDSDAAGPEQQGAHHRRLPTRRHLLLLSETCERDEHSQRLSALLSALQAWCQELLHPWWHHLHQGNRGPHWSLDGSVVWYSLATKQLCDHWGLIWSVRALFRHLNCPLEL